MIKLNCITLLRFLIIFSILATAYWIIRIHQKYSNLKAGQYISHIESNGLINITKEPQGILIISNTPSSIVDILNKQILNGLNTSICIFVRMDESLQIERYNFIHKLPSFHKIMSQVIFVDKFIKQESKQFWENIQSTNFYLNNIQYVFLDKTQQYIFKSVQEIIQRDWIYEKYQLSQKNVDIYKKLGLLDQKNGIICKEQFNQLLKKSGVRIKRQKKYKQLVISPQIKQIKIMKSYDLSKKVSYLIDWLKTNTINVIKVPQLKSKQQQIQILKVLLVLRQYNPNIKIQVSIKNGQFLKKVQRNLILNDLAIHMNQYIDFLSQIEGPDQKKPQKFLVLNTLDMFISNLQFFRNKIISNGLEIGLYITNEENFPESVFNQFSVEYLQKKKPQNSIIRNEGIYIISKHIRKEQQKIVREEKKGVYGYQFVKQSETQKISPRWIKQSIQKLKPCESQNHPQIAQYYSFNTLPYKNLFQVIQNQQNAQITIYWCFPEIYELFFALTQEPYVARIGICPQLDDNMKKKLIKISVLNDVIGKIVFTTKKDYKFLITNEELNLKLSNSNYTFTYSLIKNQNQRQFVLIKSNSPI